MIALIKKREGKGSQKKTRRGDDERETCGERCPSTLVLSYLLFVCVCVQNIAPFPCCVPFWI